MSRSSIESVLFNEDGTVADEGQVAEWARDRGKRLVNEELLQTYRAIADAALKAAVRAQLDAANKQEKE